MGSSVISASSLPERSNTRCPAAQCILGEFFEFHRCRLERLIDARLDGRLRNRFDASDVIQEAFARLQQGAEFPGLVIWPPYLWLRKIVLWTLADLRRKYLGEQALDVRREPEFDPLLTGVSSLELAVRLLDSITSPTRAVRRAERVRQVRNALELLEPFDREILVLRHVEQLTRGETAEVLGISTAASAKRYFRALTRCRRFLNQQGYDDD